MPFNKIYINLPFRVQEMIDEVVYYTKQKPKQDKMIDELYKKIIYGEIGDKPHTLDGGPKWMIYIFVDTHYKWVFHRDNDLPAVIYGPGSMIWYKNGKLHRDGGKPAIVDVHGTTV